MVSSGYFERGRRPLVVSTSLSGMLAALTLVRFGVLVAVLSPHDYGTLSVFVTMTNVLPALLSLGRAWQYQRVAREHGPAAIDHLLRDALRLNAWTFLPVLALAIALGLPFADGDVLPLALATVAISAAGSFAALTSQISLGLGYRSRSSFMMFLVNGGAALAVLPVLAWGGGIEVVLGSWAVCSVAGAVVSLLLVRRHRGGVPQTAVPVSTREGLTSIPALIGPWAFLLGLRYALGLTMSPADLAIFAISSTIADMAFLIAAAVVGVRSNRVLDGEHPSRSLVLALPVLVGLAALGTLVIAVVLPLIAQDGYAVSVTTTAALVVACAFRLDINAWRSRAVRMRRVHLTARVYLVIAVVLPLALAVAGADRTELFGIAAALGFAIIAGYQRYAVSR